MAFERLLLSAQKRDSVGLCPSTSAVQSLLEERGAGEQVVLNPSLDVTAPIFCARSELRPEKDIRDVTGAKILAQRLAVELGVEAAVRARTDIGDGRYLMRRKKLAELVSRMR